MSISILWDNAPHHILTSWHLPTWTTNPFFFAVPAAWNMDLNWLVWKMETPNSSDLSYQDLSKNPYFRRKKKHVSTHPAIIGRHLVTWGSDSEESIIIGKAGRHHIGKAGQMGYSPQMALKIKIMMINQQIWGQFSDKTNCQDTVVFSDWELVVYWSWFVRWRLVEPCCYGNRVPFRKFSTQDGITELSQTRQEPEVSQSLFLECLLANARVWHVTPKIELESAATEKSHALWGWKSWRLLKVYIYAYIQMYIYVYVYIYICVLIQIHIYIYIYYYIIYIYIYLYSYIFIYLYNYIFIYLYNYIFIYLYNVYLFIRMWYECTDIHT